MRLGQALAHRLPVTEHAGRSLFELLSLPNGPGFIEWLARRCKRYPATREAARVVVDELLSWTEWDDRAVAVWLGRNEAA